MHPFFDDRKEELSLSLRCLFSLHAPARERKEEKGSTFRLLFIFFSNSCPQHNERYPIQLYRKIIENSLEILEQPRAKQGIVFGPKCVHVNRKGPSCLQGKGLPSTLVLFISMLHTRKMRYLPGKLPPTPKANATV